MGTKRPSSTIYDTLSNINMSDHKLQPGGKISRDPSPRPAKTVQSDRERENKRMEDRRRDRENERIRDIERHKDLDQWEKYCERDRAPASRPPREGERGWREMEKRQENDRSKNGRPMSNIETVNEREVERGMKKGDTFPRITKISADGARRMMPTTGMDEERSERRQRERERRREADDWERERDRAWQRERQGRGERYREREREDFRSRGKEVRLVEDEKLRQREKYQESDGALQDKRERYATNKRDREKEAREREARVSSPHRRRDRDMYSDIKEKEKGQRREGRRDIRSEGDSDERELRRERMKEREREELTYQQSRSEGDNKGKTARERDQERQRYREHDRQKYRDREGDRSKWEEGKRRGVDRDRERYRDYDRRTVREGEHMKESFREFKDDRSDRRDDRHREREREQRGGRERKGREADPRWDEMTGRSSRSLNETDPRVPPRAQSSGEWSSDMDSEPRRGRDSYEERESGRESTTESERDKWSPERTAERRRREQHRRERSDRDRVEMAGSVPEQRRMWLDPQRGKNSQGSSLEGESEERDAYRRQKEGQRQGERSVESQAEFLREGADERYFVQGSYRERQKESGRKKYRELKVQETEGVSVDREAWRETDRPGKGHLSDSDGGIGGSWQRDTEGENVTDNTEDSDREEEGGSDYARSESGGGSERGWRQERMLSGEDGFVTVSSGGDEEDEREEEEEEEFEDCVEFWEGEIACDVASRFSFRDYEGDEEREEEWTMGKEETVDEEDENAEGQERDKKPKYVFCVIGQTLPRSKPSDQSQSQSHVDPMGGAERDESNLKSLHYVRDDVTLQPQYELKRTRNDEHTINNQDVEAERNLPREEQSCEVDRVSSEVHDTHGVAMRSKVEHHYPEMGTLKRDSQTERLLVEWREKNQERSEEKRESLSPIPSNPYGDVCTQVSYEQIQPALEAMSPEEIEAIRIRMSGTWSVSEETKRHSQAPHLKWAKNVISEILGHSSEEQTDENPYAEAQQNQEVNQSEAVIQDDKQVEETAQKHEGVPVVKVKLDGHSDPELLEEEEEEEEPVEVEGLRGMGQSASDMHADQWTVMHGDTPTYTHADTLLDAETKEHHKPAMDKMTEPSGQLQLDKANMEVKFILEDEVKEIEKEISNQKELEMYLSVSNTLYKPNSCPVLNYELESDIPNPCTKDEEPEVEENIVKKEAETQVEEPEEKGAMEENEEEEAGDVNEMDNGKGEAVVEKRVGGGTVTSSCSFRDLGPEARIRRRGIRKTTQRRKEELVEVEEEEVEEEEEEEEEGVGRDRRTRIFSTSDEEDGRSKSWSEVDLRNVLDTIGRRKRNSKFFNAAQLYQQYSEAAQNFEILRQARSEVVSVCEDASASPAPSPPPARRPLPPLPPVPHPHSLSHTGSVTSVKSLPLPEPPRSERRASSPRLSSIGQSATLWRDLPAVRNSTELEELTEDQRRLQEVRFEVVTSEASYCRSLDIVVEHFVKSKQLGALLTTQDRNWLFSRLADVRAISHSFLSKLEEQVECDILHFTVCDVIARHCQRFKMVYVPYLTNQSYQDATYQRLMNENQGFKRTVEKLERSPVCQRLPLRSFLVLPFQRITRIKLLVQNIVKRTTPGTAEATQAIKAMKLLEKLIQESNDSITQMKSIESLVSLSAKVDFECRTLPLISQSRRMVREGQVTELMDFSLKETERNIYMHLFNDYLLLSLQKEGGRFTVIDHAPVSDLRAENCRVKLHSLQKNLFRLHMSHKALLLRTDTQSDKLRWISALSRPHAEIDFSAAQDFPQMQCIRAFVAQQPDEQSLEKADVILVHQQSSDHWVEGTRLSDRQRGWIPESHLETITNSRVLQRNLSDALKLTTATAAV